MRRALAVAAVVAITIGLGATAARAQELSANDQEARSLFESGRSAFAQGRYEAALSRFQEAYELSGRSALLYNIATTHDRLRHDREAIESFEAFLAA
jgi:tetratricopeptide (TPR) repeat protein